MKKITISFANQRGITIYWDDFSGHLTTIPTPLYFEYDNDIPKEDYIAYQLFKAQAELCWYYRLEIIEDMPYSLNVHNYEENI